MNVLNNENQYLSLTANKATDLLHGENPYQKASLYAHKTVSYDIISAGWFGMYVGAGAGANFYDFKLEYKDARPDYTDSGTGFIGNLSAGIVLRISHLGITLGADYGYISRPHSTTITPRVGLNLNF